MEQATLATPITKPSITTYRVERLYLDWGASFIRVDLKGSNGEDLTHEYTGATALTLMRQLNVLNMATQSLHKRILNRLIADGVIAATVTGAPD